MIEKMFTLPARAPRLVVGITLLLTVLVGALVAVQGLGLDPNMIPLDDSHESVVAYRKLKKDYTGTGEVAMIHLRHPESVYNPKTLTRIAELTPRLEQISIWRPEDEKILADLLPTLSEDAAKLVKEVLEGGIDDGDDFALSELQTLAADPDAPPALADALDEIAMLRQPVRKVTGMANVENIKSENDSLIVGKLFDQAPTTKAGLEDLRKEILGNDLFRDLMVSKDDRSTAIIIETDIGEDRSGLISQFQLEVEKLLAEIPGEEKDYITGVPIIAATGITLIEQDNQRLFPVVILIVLVVLYLTFRSLRGVVLPLAVVVISLVGVFGLMVIIGMPLNKITASMPVFLITIGVADGIHIIAEFRDQFVRLNSRREAVIATMRHMAMPVIMTSFTTAAGFLALSITDIEDIREFGILVAVGTMFAMLISLTFIPAMMAFGKEQPAARGAKGDVAKMSGLDFKALAVLAKVSQFAYHRARWVFGVGVVMVVIAVIGAFKVIPENDFISYYAKDHPLVIATAMQDEYLAGSNLANLLVTAPVDSGAEPFRNPEILAVAEGLQQHINQLSMVGKTMSLVDMLKRINLVMHGDDAAYDRLPKEKEIVEIRSSNGTVRQDTVLGRDLISQYLVLYENGGGDTLSDVVDSGFTTVNIRVFLNTRSTLAVSTLMEEMNAYAATHFPSGMTVRLAGSAELTATSNNEVVNGQVVSLSISMIAVLVLLLIQFRSISKALLGMIPLAFAVAFNFGTMGWTGIPLNMGTAIISSVVIGIGVDFAIHYISRLQVELDRSDDVAAAIEATMLSSGKAITSNAVTVSLGFLALLSASMVPLQQAGFMLTQLLLVSAAATLIFLPASVALFRPKFARVGKK